jgi:hypothetical protein
MLRTVNENGATVAEAFGFTQKEDVSIRLCVLRNVMNPEYSKYTDVMSTSLNELTNELPPSFELIATVSFQAGLYYEKMRLKQVEELIIERFVLENYQG